MWANHVMQIEGIPSQTLRDFVYAAYVEAASRMKLNQNTFQACSTIKPFCLSSCSLIFSNFWCQKSIVVERLWFSSGLFRLIGDSQHARETKANLDQSRRRTQNNNLLMIPIPIWTRLQVWQMHIHAFSKARNRIALDSGLGFRGRSQAYRLWLLFNFLCCNNHCWGFATNLMSGVNLMFIENKKQQK